MPHAKKPFLLIVRLILVSIAMSVAYILSTLVIEQSNVPISPEEANWAGIALCLVSTINALVLSYPILRSRWHGLRLIISLFLVQFGVETFMTQIETLYFNRSIQMSAKEMIGIVSAGAIRALIFAPLAVWFLGRMKKSSQLDQTNEGLCSSKLGLRIIALTVLYPIVYFLFGYYVAWQWEETRLFYAGSANLLPFLTHFQGLFRSDPFIILFQLLRGALWTTLALLITRMMRAKRWESLLAVALIFAGLLVSGVGLFPNPYMPFQVRMSHFYEILSSMLLFGGIAGWVLYPRENKR